MRAQINLVLALMATRSPPAISLRPGARPRLGSAESASILLAVVLGYALLVPPQLTLSIGGVILPPYRLILIPSALWMMAEGMNGRVRLGGIDLLVVAVAFWVCLALFMTTDAVSAFSAAAAQATDIALAYFFGRFAIRSAHDLRIFLLLMAPGLALSGALIMLESISHRVIVQSFLGQLTGQPFGRDSGTRLGLFRAYGTFPHPILAGMFMASFLPLYVLSGLRGWPKYAGIFAALASFFTLSSAALLALVFGIALSAYNWLTERVANATWRLFIVFGALAFFAAQFGTNSGAYSLVLRFGSLNSWTGYYRTLIWDHGIRNVQKNPWFGIGYREYERLAWMSDSVDHFWLLLAIRFGVLPPILLAIAMVIVIVMLGSRSAKLPVADSRLYRAVAITLAVFALGSLSVALWLSAHVWFFMVLGIGASLAGAQALNPVRAGVRS
jgi:O-antigen ligase